ncbi:MAG: Gfo/Idh/MocA family protein [Spirochaetota bacterium]
MRTLKLGVIGTGSVVREIYEHLYFHSQYSRLISVEAICDTNAEALEAFGTSRQIPEERRFDDYRSMFEAVDLDAVAVNTPDSLHAAPTIAALEAGLDVVLPKPTADTVRDVHRIIETVERTGRFLGVDFHKREDPVVREARARVAAGAYGTLQTASFHMLDRLLVADPNHDPRFFSSPYFAARNSPVSFLTSHMADTFMYITGLRPVEVRAIGYRQKLRSLTPVSVDGYDLVDTAVLFEGGVSCHIVTGWALPNTADCLTVQSGRLIFSDGMLEMWDNHYGYREITPAGIENRNVQFKTFEQDGMVTGYGMDCPGKIIGNILRFQGDELSEPELATLRSPFALGLYTTLVCECSHASLAAGTEDANGAVIGPTIDTRSLLSERIGPTADRYFA